jgi:hypothetical protein
MMIVDGIEYQALKFALYEPGGLFPDIRLRDTRGLFSRIIRRRYRGGFMVSYVSVAEVAALHRAVASGTVSLT